MPDDICTAFFLENSSSFILTIIILFWHSKYAMQDIVCFNGKQVSTVSDTTDWSTINIYLQLQQLQLHKFFCSHSLQKWQSLLLLCFLKLMAEKSFWHWNDFGVKYFLCCELCKNLFFSFGIAVTIFILDILLFFKISAYT